MLTPGQTKALDILRRHPDITANFFAALYFDGPSHEYLFTAVSNQGNGARAGKKAWLCAGSLLGKLTKKGLVWRRFLDDGKTVFCLTDKGRKALEESGYTIGT